MRYLILFFQKFLDRSVCCSNAKVLWKTQEDCVRKKGRRTLQENMRSSNIRVHTFRSLPEYPSVTFASSSYWKFGSRFSWARNIFKIFILLSTSGRSTYILYIKQIHQDRMILINFDEYLSKKKRWSQLELARQKKNLSETLDSRA